MYGKPCLCAPRRRNQIKRQYHYKGRELVAAVKHNRLVCVPSRPANNRPNQRTKLPCSMFRNGVKRSVKGQMRVLREVGQRLQFRQFRRRFPCGFLAEDTKCLLLETIVGWKIRLKFGRHEKPDRVKSHLARFLNGIFVQQKNMGKEITWTRFAPPAHTRKCRLRQHRPISCMAWKIDKLNRVCLATGRLLQLFVAIDLMQFLSNVSRYVT